MAKANSSKKITFKLNLVWLVLLSPVVALAQQSAEIAATVPSQAVCIFDIDNTLTHGPAATADTCPNTEFQNQPPPAWPAGSGTTNWIKTAIQQCQNNGYKIAIATAENGQQAGSGGSSNPRQHRFLNSLAPTIFTPSFFQSPAFQSSCVVTSDYEGNQWCAGNNFVLPSGKEMMIVAIMNYFNIAPPLWENSIMFDDNIHNLTAASNLNLKTVQSSPNCSGKECPTGCGVTEIGVQAIVPLPN